MIPTSSQCSQISHFWIEIKINHLTYKKQTNVANNDIILYGAPGMEKGSPLSIGKINPWETKWAWPSLLVSLPSTTPLWAYINPNISVFSHHIIILSFLFFFLFSFCPNNYDFPCKQKLVNYYCSLVAQCKDTTIL